MLDWLSEPLSYGFMLRGLGTGLFAAVVCAVLSSFVLWRSWAFIGDAMSHAIFPGIVLAYILGISLVVGAIVSAVVAVFAIGFISSKTRLREDSSIGVVFTGLFALGILFLNTTAAAQDLQHILFGNILGITVRDSILLGITSLVILTIVTLSFKELLTASFDPAHAAAIGLSPEFIRYLLLMLLALTTVVAVRVVGVVLVLSLLVTPAATASLLTRRLGKMILLSLFFSIMATIIGFYVAYYADLTTGPVIVLVLISFFMLSMLTSRTQRRS